MRLRFFSRPVFLALFFWSSHDLVLAQQPTQRPLKHEDFDAWRTIATPLLSRDGRWLAYSFMPQDGDGELIIRELATGQEQRQPVGALPPPPLQPDEANPEAPPTRRAISLSFTSDSRFLVATTYPPKADMLRARKEKKKADEMPKGGLVIVNLAAGTATRASSVKNMQVPAKGGSWLAYLRDAKAPEKKLDDNVPAEARPDGQGETDPAPSNEDQATNPAAGGTAAKPEYGTDLVLRDLTAANDQGERTFPNVTEYSFARDGKNLLFAVASKTGTENGV